MSRIACPACEAELQPPAELAGKPGQCSRCRHVFLLPDSFGERTRVFVSHATVDREFVEREIVRTLERHGLETWYSDHDIHSGTEWERSIRTGLESSDWFLVVMTPRSLVSRWVKAEVHWAIDEREGCIVPVLAEDCDWKAFPLIMRTIQYVDFRRDREAARQRLLAVWDIANTAPTLAGIEEAAAAPTVFLPARHPSRPAAPGVRKAGDLLTLRFPVPEPKPRPGELFVLKAHIPDPERRPGEPLTLHRKPVPPQTQPPR